MALKTDITLESTVLVSRDQVACDLADEVVILNMRDGTYYSLNAVSARVWQMIQEPRTVREIRDGLLGEYDVEEEPCTRDLLELLEQLHNLKLVDLRDGTGSFRSENG